MESDLNDRDYGNGRNERCKWGNGNETRLDSCSKQSDCFPRELIDVMNQMGGREDQANNRRIESKLAWIGEGEMMRKGDITMRVPCVPS